MNVTDKLLLLFIALGVWKIMKTLTDLQTSLTNAETALATLQSNVTNIQSGSVDLTNEVARADALTESITAINTAIPINTGNDATAPVLTTNQTNF